MKLGEHRVRTVLEFGRPTYHVDGLGFVYRSGKVGDGVQVGRWWVSRGDEGFGPFDSLGEAIHELTSGLRGVRSPV